MRNYAYDPSSVYNQQIQSEAENWLTEDRITPPQYEAVKTAFPVAFKAANMFTRVGLFVFTLICCFSILGLVGVLFFDNARGFEIGALLIVFGMGVGIFNEKLIQQKKWYRFGSDNALLYVAVFCLSIGFVFLTNTQSGTSMSLFFLIFCGLATWRYGDPVTAFGAFYALMGCFHQLAYEGQTSALVMGICMAIPAVATYFWVKKAQFKVDLFYWNDSFRLLEVVSLVTLYLVLNYFFMDGFKHYDTPNSPFFAVTTAVVPLIYLFFGIKNKDRLLLIVGGIAVATSIATYRYYHTIMPIEWACTLAGLGLLALASGLMRYLKSPRHGFVYEEKKSKTTLAESLILNHIIGQTTQAPPTDDRFAGGNFDGGGAGKDF
jgi:hypothetical protein